MAAAADKKMSIILPDEILMIILIFLPIKSLMRFRCVNKTWLQLLTNDSQFSQLYLDHLKSRKSNNNLSLLAFREERLDYRTRVYSTVELTACDDQAVNLELPFCRGTTNPFYIVYGMCNGLILVCLPDKKEKGKGKLFIWNPFTNDYIHIPYPPPPTRNHACRSGPGWNYFGFCFVEATNQYKVIRFSDWELLTPFNRWSHISVYTLGADSPSWRNLEDIMYHCVFTDCAPTVVNEALHWIACTGFYSPMILSFDMKDEVFKEIPHPNDPSKQYSKIGEVGGSLCVLGTNKYGEKNIDIFVMQQYGVANSWIKHWTVETEIPVSYFSVRALGFTQNKEILLETSAEELILYNLETNSFKNLAQFGRHLQCIHLQTKLHLAKSYLWRQSHHVIKAAGGKAQANKYL